MLVVVELGLITKCKIYLPKITPKIYICKSSVFGTCAAFYLYYVYFIICVWEYAAETRLNKVNATQNKALHQHKGIWQPKIPSLSEWANSEHQQFLQKFDRFNISEMTSDSR